MDDPIPEIHLESTAGDPFDLATLAGSFVFALVAQAGCHPCKAILDGAREELTRAPEKGWRTVVIVPGDRQTATAFVNEAPSNSGMTIVADTLGGTSKVWGITGTSFGLVLDDQGNVRQKLPSINVKEVREILASQPEARSRKPIRSTGGAQSAANTAGDDSHVTYGHQGG